MDSDVLSVLRGAARELGAYRSGSQPGTPTTAAAAAAPTAISQPQVLLQIAALHKAFLALSEAFLEEQEGRQAERQQAVQVRATEVPSCYIGASAHCLLSTIERNPQHPTQSPAPLLHHRRNCSKQPRCRLRWRSWRRRMGSRRTARRC